MAAGHMEHLVDSTWRLATPPIHARYPCNDLRPTAGSRCSEFLTVEYVPLARAMAIARTGEIPDAKSLAALLLAQSALE